MHIFSMKNMRGCIFFMYTIDMLKRKALTYLKKWKSSDHKMSLIINGPRQIGKTFIVREFAKEYESYIEINFIEKPSMKEYFSGDLDVDTLITNLSFAGIGKFIPYKTLILFDEIQACPQALTSLKFWTQDKRYDVIATGSALGMKYNISSYPVGYIQYYDMHPLDFHEFLWAAGYKDEDITHLKHFFDLKQKVPKPIHDKMMNLLRLYMCLGGMPKIVDTYFKNKDLKEADEIQKTIYRDYINDIAIYADPNIKIKSEACYESIPHQLVKPNHKFQYSVVEHKGTARKFSSSIDWLIHAGFVIPVYNISTLSYPLESYMIDTNFRLYPTDIGLLMAYYPYELKRAILEDDEINITLKTAKGGLYEALIADFLSKKDHPKAFFYKPNDNIEIEFVLENEKGIIPLEVKAGRKKSSSLDQLLEVEEIPYGYKLANQNVGIVGKKITLPLWMMLFID